MKHFTFKSYFSEARVERIVWVYDCDDTLFRTTDEIIITGGKFKGTYSTTQWAEMDHSEIEKQYLDLSNFESGLSNPAPIAKNIEKFLENLNNEEHTYVLTARGSGKAHNTSRNLIHKDIIDGINDYAYKIYGGLDYRVRDRFPVDHVITLADDYVLKTLHIPEGTIAEQKAHVLKNYFQGELGFTKVIFVDDDKKNLALAEKLPGVEAIPA